MGEIQTYRQRVDSFKALVQRPDVAEEFQRALPALITKERFLRIALTTIIQSPKLLECDQTSILTALVQCAQLGLEPDGVLGRAYLVPYKNRAQFQLGYKGMLVLARRSGEIASIFAQAVFVNDEFEFEYGTSPRIVHRPARGDRGAFEYAYAVAMLKCGVAQFDVMHLDEIEKIKRRSPAGNAGPWRTDFEEMAKKTVLRRLFKVLPVEFEAAQAAALDEMPEYGKLQPAAPFMLPSPSSSLDEITHQLTPEDSAEAEYDAAMKAHAAEQAELEKDNGASSA